MGASSMSVVPSNLCSLDSCFRKGFSPEEKSTGHLLEIDAVPQHITVLTADGRWLYGNQVELDYYGCTLEHFLDESTLHKRIHPDDLTTFLALRRQGISGGMPFSLARLSTD